VHAWGRGGLHVYALPARRCNRVGGGGGMGGRTVKNFLIGLFVGVVCTYWYLTQGDYVRSELGRWWARASAPPSTVERSAR